MGSRTIGYSFKGAPRILRSVIIFPVKVADGAGDAGRRPHVARRPDELGVRVAPLVLADAAAAELVDEGASGESVIDDGATQAASPTQGRGTEGHAERLLSIAAPNDATDATGW